MRELKFRAWDKKTKKWLLGYDCGNLGGFSLVGECVLMGEFEALFYTLERINEIEIMQYVMNDKNGKEAYWDDIVSDGINPPFLITPDYHLLARLREIEFEIIGNKWVNPELLKA